MKVDEIAPEYKEERSYSSNKVVKSVVVLKFYVRVEARG